MDESMNDVMNHVLALPADDRAILLNHLIAVQNPAMRDESVLDEALALSKPKRALVIDALLEVGEHDQGSLESYAITPEWRAVLDRRYQRIVSGEAKGIPWAEVRIRAQQVLREIP